MDANIVSAIGAGAEPKDTKRKHPAQMQHVHPAAAWQARSTVTDYRAASSGWETPQLPVITPPEWYRFSRLVPLVLERDVLFLELHLRHVYWTILLLPYHFPFAPLTPTKVLALELDNYTDAAHILHHFVFICVYIHESMFCPILNDGLTVGIRFLITFWERRKLVL